MSFEMYDEQGDEVMSEINMTPLVDVMLVLLVIFIITVPVMKQAIKVDLPRAQTQRHPEPPQILLLGVDLEGQYRLNHAPMDSNGLLEALRGQAQKNPDTQIQIHADRRVPYDRVAQAMVLAQQAGLHKLGFVMQPEAHAH